MLTDPVLVHLKYMDPQLLLKQLQMAKRLAEDVTAQNVTENLHPTSA